MNVLMRQIDTFPRPSAQLSIASLPKITALASKLSPSQCQQLLTYVNGERLKCANEVDGDEVDEDEMDGLASDELESNGDEDDKDHLHLGCKNPMYPGSSRILFCVVFLLYTSDSERYLKALSDAGIDFFQG